MAWVNSEQPPVEKHPLPPSVRCKVPVSSGMRSNRLAHQRFWWSGDVSIEVWLVEKSGLGELTVAGKNMLSGDTVV